MPREGTNNTPLLPGVLDGIVEVPSRYSHRTLPVAGSTTVRPFEDWIATDGWSPWRIRGEHQLGFRGRSSFHRFRPVRKSSPATNASLSLSTCATTTPSAMTRDDDIPRLLLALG